MKLLLDENLPKKLKYHIPNHEVYHVSDKSWNGKKNGELLQLMLNENFQVLLTFDKNIQFQQNFEKYPIPVLVLVANKNNFECLNPLIPILLGILAKPLVKGGTLVQTLI